MQSLSILFLFSFHLQQSHSVRSRLHPKLTAATNESTSTFKGNVAKSRSSYTEKEFYQQQLRQQQQQQHFTIADKPYIKSNTILVLAYPTKPHNYVWCNDKYCIKKSKIIRFQLFEVFKIVNVDSFFFWRKQTLRKFWKVFDEDSWDQHQHQHQHHQNQHHQNKMEAVV